MKKLFLYFILIVFTFIYEKAMAESYTLGDDIYDKEAKEKNKFLSSPERFVCPTLDIKLEVSPKYGKPKIDYSKSKAEINNLSTAMAAKNESPLVAVVPSNATLIVHGLIEIADAGRFFFPHKVKRYDFVIGDKTYTKYCLIMEKIIYETGARELLIRIPNDFNNNSCVKNEIIEHEMTHVKLYRTSLSKYAKKTYEEGTRLLKKFTIPRARNTQDESLNDFKKLNKAITDLTEKNSKEMSEESDKINKQFDLDDHKKDILRKKCNFVPK